MTCTTQYRPSVVWLTRSHTTLGRKEVVGLTLIGLRARLMKGLSEKDLAFLLFAPVVPLDAENCKQEPIVPE